MRSPKSPLTVTLLIISLLCLAPAAPAAFAQKRQKEDKAAAPKEKKPFPQGTPVLWREPADIASRDLLLGPGGESMKPDLSKVTFVREETTGWSPKFRVKDGAGRTWVAKMGTEAQSETAAVRLVWAVGYETEVNYLAPCVRIEGAPQPSKGKVERCGDGGFANVRFEARPEEWDRGDAWGWSQNPFVGKRELRGLLVLMAFLNNWDLKDENNKVIYVPAAGGEHRYVVSDLGATFGKSGGLIWQLSRSRNKPEDFAKQKFISEVRDGKVSFKFAGKNSTLFESVTVEDARWIGGLLARLSDKQLSDAFRAANYTDEQARLLTAAVRAKTDELVNLPGGAGAAGAAR